MEAKLFSFFQYVYKLKLQTRTGWVRSSVNLPESVSDHMYAMSLISWVLVGSSDTTLDKTKVIKMALVHDLAEAVVGDITPFDGVSQERKKQLEDEAMKKMLSELGGNPITEEIYALFLEYENQETDEAKFIKDVDKLEMLLQGNFYEQTQQKDLSQFFDHTPLEGFRHPVVKGVAKEVFNNRKNAKLAEPK